MMLKTILIAAVLATAGVAPVAAEGFPNLYATNMGR
jgi:hypothetical protein